jgi:hypothetical protein
MKRKRSTKPNHRPRPKTKIKNPASPWRAKTPRVAAEIIIPPVSDADALADEIEEIENDPDAEPLEEGE